MRRHLGLGTLLAVAAMGVAGCGGSESTADSDAKLADLEERVQAAEQKATDAEAKAQSAEEEASASADSSFEEPVSDDTPSDEAESSGTDKACIKVPDVVGEDHQLAQDTMQAAGLYMLLEEDASGQDRSLVWDRNWTTVRQRPAAGKCVSSETEVTLYAVKDTER